MNVIIHSIREGAREIGQIDISQVSQEQYPIFAEALNRIAKMQLVPSNQPKSDHRPSIIQREVFTPEQEEQIAELLAQYAPAKRNLSKTFFVGA